MKIYIEVKVSDRLPDIGIKHVTTFASQGSGSTTFSKVTHRVQEFMLENKEYWLEEIELPSEEEIINKVREVYETSDLDSAPYKSLFEQGANYILNKIIK